MRIEWWVIGLCLTTAIAIQGADDSIDLQLKLRDFEQKTASWDDIYPDLNLRGFGSSGGRDWTRLAVRMDIVDSKAKRDDTWADLIELRWNVVLALGRSGLDRPRPDASIRFTRTVKYVNVRASRKGVEYWAMIFIPPEVFQRYGKRDRIPDDRILGRLDVYRGHRHAGTIWFHDGKAHLGDRPSNKQVHAYVNSEDPRPANYGLLIRPETPWAFSSSDSDKLMRLAPLIPQ